MENGFWSTVIATIIGGGVSIVATWFFYRKAGNELREDAANLRRQSNALLGAVLNPDAKREIVSGKDGSTTGVIVGSVGSASGTSSAGGTSEPPAR